jgi:hypothetical protein
MLKLKFEIRIFNAGGCFEFNLIKWKVGVTIDENQHAEYFKFHLGPVCFGLIWDKNPFN